MLIALAACGSGAVGQTIHVGAQDRSFMLHVPRTAGASRYPLVIALHGGSGTAANMANETRFHELADREGFAVVYPQGIDRRWNDGRDDKDAVDVDDVAYISALIDRLVGEYPIDPARVFVTGISNGGMMSYRLGCELADKIAAIAPVAAQVPAAIAGTCSPSRAVSVLAINGTADPQVPWGGGFVFGDRGRILDTESSLAVFSRRAGCSGTVQRMWEPDRAPDDGTTVQHVIYTACAERTSVELLAINHGGHTWPGGTQYYSPELVGLVSQEFSATERIWAFFDGHGR